MAPKFVSASTAIQLDGVKDFVEIPDHDAFSVNTTGELTVSAWVRPDTLSFSKIEGSGYVDFLRVGKGEGSKTSGNKNGASASIRKEIVKIDRIASASMSSVRTAISEMEAMCKTP